MQKNSTIFLFVICLYTAFAVAADRQETEQQRQERMKWWTEARFGMFIHWGLYAMPARHEWVKNRERIPDEDYQIYFDLFHPDLYNPEQWAKAAKNAGMKYFVVTAKHHEGFCLWDSKYTDYKVTNTPYGKDLLKPMVEAFRAEGLKVGFYYSLIDWHHPEYPVDRIHPMRDNKEFRQNAKDRDVKKYAEYLHSQVRELLTDFGTINCLFLDYSFPGEDGKGHDDWQSEKLLAMVRELQPNVIVNDRLDLLDTPGGWDFRTPEQFMPRSWITVNDIKVPWETCQTFSGSWGYYRDENTWKSVHQLVVMLIETVSKGGNLLLNVGPTGRGTFDQRAMDRLQGMGEWIKYHDRSIYGCTQAPEEFQKPDNCLLTYNLGLNRLYIHVLEWPFKSLHLDGYAGKVKYAQLLNDASEIRFAEKRGAWMAKERGYAEETLTLQLPVNPPDVTVPVIELFLK
ncbi:alpha-L-fucosidase [candidate division KSB1 bacterium]|nr:alpha-L-fucosidase [candidate division KSB1 bacterium]